MKWLFGFAVAIATSVTGAMTPAYALTCTAPGQDTCTITCPAGCIAIYRVPSGPCRTKCSGSSTETGTNIDAKNLSAVEILRAMREKIKR